MAIELLRADEVGALFGVDASTVHRWERAGRLRRARRDPGGTKYWLADELRQDLAASGDDGPGASVRPGRGRPDAVVAATRRPRRRRVG